MKHKSIFKRAPLLFPLFLVVVLFGVTQMAKADVDQECSATYPDYDGYKNISGESLSQTFIPSTDRLFVLSFDVKGDGEEGSGEIGVLIYKGSNLVASSTVNMDEPSGVGMINFSFNPDIVTVPGDTYKIKPYITGDNVFLGWFYDEDGCYSSGKAIVGGASQNYDFAFATGGYNYDEVYPSDAPEEDAPVLVDPPDDPDPADESDEGDFDEDDTDDTDDTDSDSSNDEAAAVDNSESEEGTSEDSSQNATTPSENSNLATTTQTSSNLNNIDDDPASDKDLLKKFFILGYILLVGLAFLGYGTYRHIKKKKQIDQNINK